MVNTGVESNVIIMNIYGNCLIMLLRIGFVYCTHLSAAMEKSLKLPTSETTNC